MSEEVELKEVFGSRTNKHRALKIMKDNLPATPRKRAAVLGSYLSSTKSPTIDIMQKLNKIPSPEDTKNVEMSKAILTDIKGVIDDAKLKRTNDARATINIFSAAVNGKNVKNKNKQKLSVEFSYHRNLDLMPDE